MPNVARPVGSGVGLAAGLGAVAAMTEAGADHTRTGARATAISVAAALATRVRLGLASEVMRLGFGWMEGKTGREEGRTVEIDAVRWPGGRRTATPGHRRRLSGWLGCQPMVKVTVPA